MAVRTDFSREKEAFSSFLESRETSENSDNMKSSNAELVKKFEKFLTMEELFKQGHGKHGHQGHGKHGHGGGKRFWSFWAMYNTVPEAEKSKMEEGWKNMKLHKQDKLEKHWGKHGPFGKHGHFGKRGHHMHHHYGKHGPFGKHGHKHGHHGHGHHGHHGWEGKQYWSLMAMYNAMPENITEDEFQRVIEGGRNPSPPPQGTDAQGNPTTNFKGHRFGRCMRQWMRFSPSERSNAALPKPAETSAQTEAATNDEAPQNLASMVENINIANSPTAENVE